MNKKYYSAHNHYGTETGIGFANTWYLLAWDSISARSAFLDAQTDMASRAITKKEITKYLGESVKPFSGQRLVIRDHGEINSKGLIGDVIIDYVRGTGDLTVHA